MGTAGEICLFSERGFLESFVEMPVVMGKSMHL